VPQSAASIEMPGGIERVYGSTLEAVQAIVAFELTQGFEVERNTKAKGSNGETGMVTCKRGCTQEEVEWRIRQPVSDGQTLVKPAYIMGIKRLHRCRQAPAPVATGAGRAAASAADPAL